MLVYIGTRKKDNNEFQLPWKLDGSILLYIATEQEITQNLPSAEVLEKVHQLQNKWNRISHRLSGIHTVLKSYQVIMMATAIFLQ